MTSGSHRTPPAISESEGPLTREEVLEVSRALFQHYGWNNAKDLIMRNRIQRMRDMALESAEAKDALRDIAYDQADDLQRVADLVQSKTPRTDRLVLGGAWGHGEANGVEKRGCSDEAFAVAKRIIGTNSFADPYTLALWVDHAWSLEREIASTASERPSNQPVGKPHAWLNPETCLVSASPGGGYTIPLYAFTVTVSGGST